jgi:hypothetical protein
MTPRRFNRLTKNSFHEIDEIRDTFKDWFDIDICAGIWEAEIAQVKLMFYRRHLYEHNGGEVDQKYLDKSGDTTVRLKQVIRETQQGAHGLLGSLLKMVRNLHVGFHVLFEVEDEPIRAYEDKKTLVADSQKR